VRDPVHLRALHFPLSSPPLLSPHQLRLLVRSLSKLIASHQWCHARTQLRDVGHYRRLAKCAIENSVSHSSSLGQCCSAGHLRSLKLLHSGDDPRPKAVQRSRPHLHLFVWREPTSFTFLVSFAVEVVVLGGMGEKEASEIEFHPDHPTCAAGGEGRDAPSKSSPT